MPFASVASRRNTLVRPESFYNIDVSDLRFSFLFCKNSVVRKHGFRFFIMSDFGEVVSLSLKILADVSSTVIGAFRVNHPLHFAYDISCLNQIAGL